jgi:hypothetical protein
MPTLPIVADSYTALPDVLRRHINSGRDFAKQALSAA